MVEVECLSIAEFAEKAGVSKQAIYKQVNNEKSQLTPYIIKEGRRTLIKTTALVELYGVDMNKVESSTPTEGEQTTQDNPNTENGVDYSTQISTPEKPADNPKSTFSTQENQPISTDYIAFLKAEIAELKAERADREQHFNDTIREKDAIIKEQTERLASLAQQVAQLADKALIATSQQQYLTAMEKAERAEPVAPDGQPAEEMTPAEPKRGFWSWLFNR